jgi:hypothetical protein
VTPEQVATNARAVRAVAERLEREGHAAPEVLADELTALLARHGWKPTEQPPPLHGPASTPAGRAAAKRIWESRPKRGKF